MYSTTYSTNRTFEWTVAVIMLLMGIGVMICVAFGFGIAGVFVVLTDLGLNHAQIGVLFILVGGLSCAALLANGRWRVNGCYLRAAGCSARLFVWLQLFAGVVQVMIRTEQFFLVMVVWGVFAVAECVSILVAILDRNAYPRKVSANASGHP